MTLPQGTRLLGRALFVCSLVSIAAVAVGNELRPPSADDAIERLENSPRHGEFVEIEAPKETGGPVRTWVVYPERAEKAGVVIVIHEIFGMTDWDRAVGDAIAEAGFIAVVPDLLSGQGAGGGNSDSFADRGARIQAVRQLESDHVMTRLNAVRDHALAFPSANGRSGCIGFCWGGGTSFDYATAQPKLDAAVVYYGRPPEESKLSAIEAPVLGLYGERDARITSTVAATKEAMKERDKSYQTEIFVGAGHAFVRQQSGFDGANGQAAISGWKMMLDFLRENLNQ